MIGMICGSLCLVVLFCLMLHWLGATLQNIDEPINGGHVFAILIMAAFCLFIVANSGLIEHIREGWNECSN